MDNIQFKKRYQKKIQQKDHFIFVQLIYINIFNIKFQTNRMRLATDYQQTNKNNSKKQTNEKVNIVKLGRGIPIQEKKKRGISISHSNEKIREQSLGRDEVSKQKRMQINMLNTKNLLPNKVVLPKANIIYSAATYGQKQSISSPRYYNNQITPHQIIESNPKIQSIKNRQRHQKEVNSVSVFKRSSDYVNQHVNSDYCTEKHISRFKQNPKLDQKTFQLKNAASIQKINFLPVNSNLKESRQNYFRTHLSTEKQQIKYINPNKISMNIKPPTKQIYSTDYQMNLVPNHIQSKKMINLKSNSPSSNNQLHFYKNQHLRETLKNIEVKEKSHQNNNRNLINSKITQKNQYSPRSTTNNKQSLTVTKKYLNNVAEIKELASSIDIEQQSRSRIYNSKGQGFISLWDANKTESIVSMTQSRQIKIQQSQIMLDYFNPRDSMLKKL